ncbi:hypothetical protein PR048_006064 [Dryococelus australis]|uniref:Uncharacterized protein n=1 Tax=Dryococelus australis TaxID=614101 RepID=A0ABQ9IAW8_9NEOP|nr:hypothetical protein PR048_006064 [Dryococelus australis]
MSSTPFLSSSLMAYSSLLPHHLAAAFSTYPSPILLPFSAPFPVLAPPPPHTGTRDQNEKKGILDKDDEQDCQKVVNDEDEIDKHCDPDWEGSAENTEANHTEYLSSNIACVITQKGTGVTQRVVTQGECSTYQEEIPINELGKVVNKRRKTAEQDEWFDKQNKELRWSREGKKRKRGACRGERKMWPACNSAMCKISKVRECTKLLQEDRQKLFQSFWKKMNWDPEKSVHSIADKESNKTVYKSILLTIPQGCNSHLHNKNCRWTHSYFVGLYREYSRQCQEKTPPVKPLSGFTYENVVHDTNIGLQIPKKDRSMVKYDSIRPGRKTHDPIVNDIKVIKYSPDGTIQVKLNFDDEYIDLPHRTSRNEYGNFCDFPQLINEPIKTKYNTRSANTYRIIPVDCGPFYDSLPHECGCMWLLSHPTHAALTFVTLHLHCLRSHWPHWCCVWNNMTNGTHISTGEHEHLVEAGFLQQTLLMVGKRAWGEQMASTKIIFLPY